MGITATQLEQRRSRIGSSDMAAIMGLDPFRNAYDVWLEKTGKLESDIKETEVMRLGTLLEPSVLQYAEEELGKLTRNQYRSAKDVDFPMGANVDAILVASGEPVEAKTSGLQRGFPFEDWGESLSDQVPDRVIIQATFHLICLAEIKMVCHVPALLGGRGFDRFVVPRDEDIIDALKTTGHNFWHKHVLADLPPENLTPSLAVIKRVRREPSKTVEVPASIVETWQENRQTRLDAQKAEDASLASLLTAIGDAEAADCPLGTFTYLEQKRAGYTVEETKFRVARFKKAK